MSTQQNTFTITKHPKYKNYGCDEAGNIYSFISGYARKLVTSYVKTNFKYKTFSVVPRKGETKSIRVHRFVWECFNGPIKGKRNIDHIDRNPENNALSNLRLATCAQQQYNIGKINGNTISSKFKGVAAQKQKGKLTGRWKAQIKKNCKSIYLGLYDTEEEAAQAYDEAANVLFGEEWACTNKKLGLL